jgi:hypothetical protein
LHFLDAILQLIGDDHRETCAVDKDDSRTRNVHTVHSFLCLTVSLITADKNTEAAEEFPQTVVSEQHTIQPALSEVQIFYSAA